VCLETEQVIRTYGGLRQEGSSIGDLEIIRTSVDRPEIGISIQPIERGQQTSYEQLFAFLHNAVDPNTILHRSRRNVRINTMFYPDRPSLPGAKIFAAVGDNDSKWYTHAELLLHDGAEEELRRWGLSQ